MQDTINTRGLYRFRVRDAAGVVVADWTDHNRVVDEGLDYALSAALAGGSPITSWYLGLTDSAPSPDAADTLGSHSGWSEVTAYDESARQAWTPGSVSGQSVDNGGSVATFTINADSTTIGGAFLASADSGTSGTLFSIAAFSGGDVTLSAGSTLEVTARFTDSAA